MTVALKMIRENYQFPTGKKGKLASNRN